MDLWGGGGKLVEYRAALLASHGIASLALDYLTSKITVEKGKMVDNTYFEVNLMSDLEDLKLLPAGLLCTSLR